MNSHLSHLCFMIIQVIIVIAVVVVIVMYTAHHDEIRHQQPYYNSNIVILTNQYHSSTVSHHSFTFSVHGYAPIILNNQQYHHHHHNHHQRLGRISQRQHRIHRIYSQSSLGRLLRYYYPNQVTSLLSLSSVQTLSSSTLLSSTVTSSPPPASTSSSTTNVSSDDVIVTTTSNNNNNIINNNTISSTISNNSNTTTFNTNKSTTTTTTTIIEIRNQLLTLLSSMKGNENELRQVEEFINYLENQYIPCQTISFLNLMMSNNNSTWQFIFSTNIVKRSNSNNHYKKFRLREVKQSIQCNDNNINSMHGTMINTCIWEYNQQYNNNIDDDINNNNNNHIFDCYGTFSIIGNYTITSSGRIVYNTTEPERIIQLLPKSTIPNNITQLMYYIQTNLCYELFDPTFHSYDITYMDDQIRIIRYTGIRYEGIRNIFIRK